MMIRAYRMRGHLAAHLDPLNMIKPSTTSRNSIPKTYGFGPKRHGSPHLSSTTCSASNTPPPRQMLDILKRTYCGTFAVEFMHISDPEEKSWIQQRIEGKDKEISFTPRGQARDPEEAGRGEAFERFLHKRYPGTKRFGLDGGEALSRRWSRSSSAAARSASTRSSSACPTAAASTCSRP